MIRSAFKKLLRAMCVVQKTKDIRALWPHIRRLEKAVAPSRSYAIVEWPDLEKVCSYQHVLPGKTVLGSGNGILKCSHGSHGEVYRCCRLMCPVWDEWSGVMPEVRKEGEDD